MAFAGWPPVEQAHRADGASYNRPEAHDRCSCAPRWAHASERVRAATSEDRVHSSAGEPNPKPPAPAPLRPSSAWSGAKHTAVQGQIPSRSRSDRPSRVLDTGLRPRERRTPVCGVLSCRGLSLYQRRKSAGPARVPLTVRRHQGGALHPGPRVRARQGRGRRRLAMRLTATACGWSRAAAGPRVPVGIAQQALRADAASCYADAGSV